MLAPGEAWHYSNLAFGLLGEIVARHDGDGYEDALRARVLAPLGLDATGFDPSGPRATGYYVDPYSDAGHRRAATSRSKGRPRRWAGSGRLSTIWRGGPTSSRPVTTACSRATTLDEMARVRTMVDHDTWEVGWGLGLGLYRRGDRVFAGHGGAMPGFLAMLFVDRRERTGAAVLVNTSAGFAPETLGLDLAEAVLETLVRTPAALAAGRRCARRGRADPRAVVVGGRGARLRWKGGRLEIELPSGPPGRNVSWLTPEADDRWRVVEGRELGEQLRVVRDGAGAPVRLYVATYPLTRAPAVFADVAR